MPAVFDNLGIRFQYPENWTLEEDHLSGQRAVTVYSPSGAFWSVMIHPAGADRDALAREAMAVLRAEYPDLESEPSRSTLDDTEMVGYDLYFFYLDLTNTAQVRCFRGPGATYAVLSQGEDRDFQALQKVFEAITLSLIRG